MARYGMVDLETLGTRPDAAILTIGAIKFDPHSGMEPYEGRYWRLHVDEQTALGRTVDDGTVEWWGKQSPEIRDEALGDNDRVKIADFAKEFNKWCVGLEQLWCQGPLFDYAIIQNLYEQARIPVPFNYWQIRDSRTLFDLMPEDPRKSMQSSLHNALADCYYQAKCVQQVFKQLGVKKK